MTSKFREDINALRAVAVVAVMVFHFNHSWLPGGFAGVDVFFVISGFLMTMIVVNGLNRGTFSLLSFYKARVNRILPALAFLCFVVMALGYFLLSPLDYLVLGKHVASSLTFTSNIAYWMESNYFDSSSNEKWLLHTWSLSVEWQFYLIYPVALSLLYGFLSIKQLKHLLVAATVSLLLLSIFVTLKSSSAAYFLLPTRAWQMLAGGLVFLHPIFLGNTTRNLFQIVGLSAIFVSFFIFSPETQWPGYSSLLPVLGTCLVLTSNYSDSKLVNNKICHLIGKWSYSIYLWHWPVVVAGFYFSFGEYWWLLGILLSTLLGASSFKFIESKKLGDYRLRKVKALLNPLPFAAIIAGLGVLVYLTNGIIGRLPEPDKTLALSAIVAQDDWNYPPPNTEIKSLKIRKINGTSDRNILFLGASHIEQTYPYVASLDSEYNIYFLTAGGCLVTPSMKNPKWSCDNVQNYKDLFEELEFEKVVTSFYSFTSYLSDDAYERDAEISKRLREYDDFLKYIKSASKSVYLILGEPKGEEFDPKSSIRNGLRDFITETEARNNYLVHMNALRRLTQLEGITVIDPIRYLCQEGFCKTRNSTEGYFYRDKNHMRPWYAIKSMSYLDVVFL